MTPTVLPVRREDDLLVHSLSDETLVYDLKRDLAHCLNRTAADVWFHCDGSTTVDQLAKALQDQHGIHADQRVIWFALRQLERARLLQTRIERPSSLSRISRRDLMRTLGIAAAVPAIMTIAAPEARAQASNTCSGRLAPCGTFRCPGTLTCRGVVTCSCA